MTFAIIVLAVVCLAFANGANDNFKGVATLFGTGTTGYRGALMWATVTTLLGSLTAVFLAEALLQSFTGKGLVATELTTDGRYVSAVALGAGLTVLLATRIGMPISTTHSLVGALAGAGWAAASTVDLARLAGTFFVPLLLSPLLAIVLTAVCYRIFGSMRRRAGVTEETCVCVGSQIVEIVPSSEMAVAMQRVDSLSMTVDDEVSCRQRYGGTLFGIQAATALDSLHYLSAGVVSFARGLNDTPKIAALLLVVPQFGGLAALVTVGVVIAIGGLLSARKVADTMSNRITTMNHGQGFTANLITGVIVIGASRFGVPVSTTHVSCGSLCGIGTVTGQGQWATMAKIFVAWVTTLPVAALLGAIAFWAIGLIVAA